eukprot:Ihof_evm2s248 gene=Ihof_evmTU2s248
MSYQSSSPLPGQEPSSHPTPHSNSSNRIVTGYISPGLDYATPNTSINGTVIRRNSEPSLFETTDDETGQPMTPERFTRRVRSKSFGNEGQDTFGREVLRLAHLFGSTSVYEHVDYNESDAEYDAGSETNDYGRASDGESNEGSWLFKAPILTYGGPAARRENGLTMDYRKNGKEIKGNNKKKTVFTIFKAFIASGILFLPHGYAISGWLLANIILLIVGILATYAMLLLLQTKDKLVNDGIKVLSFGDLAYHAYGNTGRYWVDIIIFGSQMGFCCAYFAFVGHNANSVFFELFDCLSISKTFIMVCLVPILVPMVWVRRLTYYAITNIIADILIVVPLIYMAVTQSLHIKEHGIGPNVVAFNWTTFLPFFGTTVYGLEGIAMVLPIEQAMKEKEKLPRVLSGCMFAIILLMGSFGTLSYITFGDQTESIITLNMGTSKEENAVVSIIKLAYCVAIIFTFPLMMFPSCKIIERRLFKHERHSGKKWSKNATRLCLVLICCGIAVIGAEHVDNFVSIVGAVCCTPLAFIFPALFHLK